MAEPDIKRLPISEFRERGYLHEVNRLVLHPLGLALEVQVVQQPSRVLAPLPEEICVALEALALGEQITDTSVRTALHDWLDRAQPVEEGGAVLGRVWDCQDDAEGVVYGEDLLSPDKAERVCKELLARRDERKKHTGGWVIQPIPDSEVLSTTYTDPTLRSTGQGVVEPGRFAGVELPDEAS